MPKTDIIMKTIRALALAGCLFGTVGAAPAAGPRILVIGHPLLALNADDVQEIYLGDKQLAGSTKLVPVDNLSAQDEFLILYVNLDAAKYRARWIRKAFRDGLIAPPVRSTDIEVIEFVKRTPGALGYVRSPAPTGVAVLGEKS